jgi:hypothetical protein
MPQIRGWIPRLPISPEHGHGESSFEPNATALYIRDKGLFPSSAPIGTAYQPFLQAIGRQAFSGQYGTPPLKALPGK